MRVPLASIPSTGESVDFSDVMGSSSVISFGAVINSALTRRSFYAFLQD